MSTPVSAWRTAWEPLTPRGVAAFAGSSFARLFLIQFFIASIATFSTGVFLETSWFPIVRSAIQVLPAEGAIANGELSWQGNSPVQLAENRFLGLAVDLYHSGELGRAADLQLEFGQRDLRVYWLPGYEILFYPPDARIAFNRTELEPWWGAWEPWILVLALLATMAGLLVSWQWLATLYCLPVWVISFLINRDLSLSQSWRLAGAATLPGALFMTAGIFAYNFHAIDLIRLGAVGGLHFVIGWIYLILAPWFCPRAVVENPAGKKVKGNANPFTAGD